MKKTELIDTGTDKRRKGKPKSKPVTNRVEAPPPSNKIAQNLLYDLMIITDHLLKKPDRLPLRKPRVYEEDVKVSTGASENYKRMSRFALMGYYHLIGDSENYLKFRNQTLRFIREERVRGHMGGEEGCNQPHDGLHLSAVLVAHLFATITHDIELLQETGWWLAAYFALCLACYHPSYPRWPLPGFRIKDEPFSEVRDIICYHCIKDLKLEQINLERDAWRNKYSWQRMYLPVRLAVYLKSVGAMPKPSGVLPRLYAPISVTKMANGIEVEMSVPEGTSGKAQTVDFIEIDNGKLTYGRPDGTIIEAGKAKPTTERTGS